MPNKQIPTSTRIQRPGVSHLNRALVREAIRQDQGIGRADIAALRAAKLDGMILRP